MSSAALLPSSLEYPELAPRRAFLAICSPVPAAPRALPEPLAALPIPGPPPAPQAENTCSVPAGPGVAPLHVPELATSTGSASREASSSLRDELVAMLPSLERRAFRWCRDSVEARDLAQDTVVRALGHPPRFDTEGHLRAWLYTVLRNLFISRRRRAQSFQRACGELSVGLQRLQEAPPAAPFLTPSVERALARLPEAFARVIRLVDLEDYSYADAASLLGVPVGTVMSRLFRARQRLARDLPASV
jgi:RNA polymerase sigma-70 factor, ECF subfamily